MLADVIAERSVLLFRQNPALTFLLNKFKKPITPLWLSFVQVERFKP